MKLIGKISLVVLGVLFCISCECPYQDELDRAQYRKSSTGDVFHADVLLGTWQCYYPMIIGGMEFKQIKFMRSGSNISLTIEGYLFPELYLRDSFGRYTMAKRRADGC